MALKALREGYSISCCCLLSNHSSKGKTDQILEGMQRVEASLDELRLLLVGITFIHVLNWLLKCSLQKVILNYRGE